MSSFEPWADGRAEGFALAAAAQNDAEALRARNGLAAGVADAATRVARELARLPRSERRSRVGALTQREWPAPNEAQTGRPPRALGLLAAVVSKDLGRDWLAAAPFPRPGFKPEAQLLALLRTLAARRPKAESSE